MVEITRLIISVFFNLEALAVFSMNIFVFICMIKGRLFWGEGHAVYVLIGFSVLCETFQTLLHLLYIGPSFFEESYALEEQDSSRVMAIGILFISFCYLGSLIQILLATNRYALVYFPSRTFLTQQRVLPLIALCCITAIGMITYSQLILPCCRIVPDPRIYSYSYINVSNGTYNFAMNRVDLPLFFATSIYSCISYIAFFEHIGRIGTGANTKYLVQFTLLFLTYATVWLTFFLLPLIGIQTPEVYALTSILLILNCGANSIVYLAFSKEVRHAANQLLCRNLFKDDTRHVPKAATSNQVHPQATANA